MKDACPTQIKHMRLIQREIVIAFNSGWNCAASAKLFSDELFSVAKYSVNERSFAELDDHSSNNESPYIKHFRLWSTCKYIGMKL